MMKTDETRQKIEEETKKREETGRRAGSRINGWMTAATEGSLRRELQEKGRRAEYVNLIIVHQRCKSSPLLLLFFLICFSFIPRSLLSDGPLVPLLTPLSTDYNQSPLNMGQYTSKPENPHIRDRIRLCDGLNPLFGSTVAAAGNGRCVFILGDKSVKLRSDGTDYTTYSLDYIDLLRSARTRFECVGGFFNFGTLVGFYALDERTVVLIDINDTEKTLRQRLISIDSKRGRTFPWLDRSYQLQTRALFFIGRSAVSEDRVITMAPSVSGRLNPVALVYPKNPLNLSVPVVNISPLLVEAGNRVRAMGGDTDLINLSVWDAPFFMSPTKIGFFTDRSGMLTVDPSLIVICDIQSASISIERSKSDVITNFPFTKDGRHPYDLRSFTGSRDHLGLVVSHRCSANSWRTVVGSITDRLSRLTFYAFLVLAQNEWARLAHRFLYISIFLGLLKFKIMRPPGARIGTMNTRTLQWIEQAGAADPSQFASMKTSVFHDGHTLIYDKVTQKRIGTREIGVNWEKEPSEEIRIVANPGRITSLKTLSEMQLRKRPLITRKLAVDSTADSMGAPDVVFGQFYTLSSTTTNVFNVKPCPSTSIRMLQPVIRDLRTHLSPLFCDGVEHVMEGLAYKRSAPLRHFYFWRRVKDCMRNAKKVGDSKLSTLVGNIEQKLLQSSSYAPRTSVLMYIQAALVARLTRLAQIRRSACVATDEMIGHMEKNHWLAFSRFLIGLIADLSARAKEDGERTIKIMDRLSQWIVECGEDEQAKRALKECEPISVWWKREAIIGEEGSQPDQAILRRLMVVTDNDIVATRVREAMKSIEAEEKRKNDLFTDLGQSIKWRGGEEEGTSEEKDQKAVKEESIEEDEDEMEESIEEKEEERKVKIEEDECEEGWTIDRGKIEEEEVKKEEDDDGWGDFRGVQVKPESFKKKKKKMKGKDTSGESTVAAITVVEENDGVKKKKKKKRKLEVEVESTETEDEPVMKKKLKKSTVVDSVSISQSQTTVVKKKKKKKFNQMAYVASDGFRVSNIKNPANQKASAYWMWFKYEGRDKFRRLWKCPHEQTNPEHKEQIMQWWSEVKATNEHNKWKHMADQFNKDPEKVKKFRDAKKANYRKALTINPDAMFELKKNHDAKIAEINPASPKFAFGAPMKGHYGRAMFREKYGVDYEGDTRAEHRYDITEMWNAVRASEEGWEAASKKLAPIPRPREPRTPFPIRKGECYEEKWKENSLRKMGTGIMNSLHWCESEDDVLRDLTSFLLVVNEYTSNIKGDRVCPSEVTLLSYSLTRGMKKELSKICLFKQGVITERDQLNENEYSGLLESFEKTGIAAERHIQNERNPVGPDVTPVERMKSLLLQILTEPHNKMAPIMFLKSNYNESAGTLFTLFPDYWEHLEARFCFLDDMFKIYTKIQKSQCDIHPIRDYRDLPSPTPCAFHKNKLDKLCTLTLAVSELQMLFKNLSDAKVLDMHHKFDPQIHLGFSQDNWDNAGRIEWGEVLNADGDERRRENDRRAAPIGSSDDDSDDSLDDDVPRVPADAPSSYGNPQHSRCNSNETSNNGRGGGNRYDGGYDGERGSGFGSAVDHERTTTNGSVYSDRNARDISPPASSHTDRSRFNGPPPSFNERDARPAQRRRQASPTQSEIGTGDGRSEEAWRNNQRSQDDLRSHNGSVVSMTKFSRPTTIAPRGGGGGGVFGNRKVVSPERPLPPHPRSISPTPRAAPVPAPRRGVFGNQAPMPPMPLPFYMPSMGGSDSVPVTSRPRGDVETIERAVQQRQIGVLPPPITVPAKKREATPPPETSEDEAERVEDERIRATIKLLPRGSFDAHMKSLREARDPRVTPIFRPYLWSAAVESRAMPLHPDEAARIEDEMRDRYGHQ
ncbi:hypothetical protein PRIPAC_90210 [Pristionchus pacificus]|uniref:Uncharacterized protein n=1 Tax=Pristionchus pacificus TaxID=54126 RepID=A0A2A6CZD0_PRIPA|nr:hypothetical protein PRIPAC_90210 [Pristionchus pacificus]|eukprot:PDM83383.1 hypothetical protein PRIPAC_35015 [Pristionchus pacificus]